MNELFSKFGKDEEEEGKAPPFPKKKSTGMEKPKGKDAAVDNLVERMAGASASAGRAKKSAGKKAALKKRGKGFPFKKKEEEKE